MTASITRLPEVTRRVGPPRALEVPDPLGYPLGAANDHAGQVRRLRELLALCMRDDVPLLARAATP